jgi:multimeric flavodoxin WrbA
MNILVISASPNNDGLTVACANAAAEGVQLAGGRADHLLLNQADIGRCHACDRGWGTCLEKHVCQVLDGFQAAHQQVLLAQGYILVTPVYYGEMSETTKAFTDRLRRCEATRKEKSGLYNKPIIAVAAAGGSGNGMITCLASLERWIEHTKARKFDFIAVNRWNKEYKITTIRSAAQSLTLGLIQAGPSS